VSYGEFDEIMTGSYYSRSKSKNFSSEKEDYIEEGSDSESSDENTDELDDDDEKSQQRRQEYWFTTSGYERASPDVRMNRANQQHPREHENKNKRVLSNSEPANTSGELHPILDQPIPTAADISGGFAQSIALARVFVRVNAGLIILDEAMNKMDQIKLRQLLPKLFKFIEQWNMSLIIITHNVNILPFCHKIFVLKEGELVLQGTHHQLTETTGFYPVT